MIAVPKKAIKISVILDMENETCKVFRDDEEVALADFCFDDTQIRVSNVGTVEEYQRNGYGRLLFAALFLLAQQQKKPILLWALEDAIPFYEKIGMLHLNDPKVQRKVRFGNCEEEDRSTKIDEDDFIWIPSHLKKRPIIYL